MAVMKKLKRADKESNGGGSGKEFFCRTPFRVVHWSLSNAVRGRFQETTLEIETAVSQIKLRFDGHQPLRTVNDCIAQLTAGEINRLLRDYFESGVKEGKRQKARQIREALCMEDDLCPG